MNYGYIYKVTNVINNKIYIGYHKCKKDSITETDMINDGYWGSGTLISKAESKYGIENFAKQIVCVCENKEDLIMMEKLCIFFAKVYYGRCCYNVAEGGDGGNTLEYMNESQKKQRSEKISKGGKQRFEHITERQKHSNSCSGYKNVCGINIETNEKTEVFPSLIDATSFIKSLGYNTGGHIGECLSGKSFTAYGYYWIAEGSNNPHYTAEQIKRLKENNIKEKYSCPVVRQHMKEAGEHIWEDFDKRRERSEKYSQYKNIYGINIKTNEKTEIFPTQIDAKQFIKSLGYKTADNISAVLSGKRKSAYGYYWFAETKKEIL